MILENGGPPLDLEEAVLFPFDSRSVPLRYRLQPGLVTSTNPYKPHPRVLEPGGPEAPDHLDIKFYGTVIRIGDELRMWYIGVGEEEGEKQGRHICYAVSQDGLHWEKPELGMVEFNGNKRNNLVQFESPHRESISALLVLYDPEDPDPERRFKLISEIHPFHIIAAFSPDGLTWTESPHNPILKHNAIEPGGLMKFKRLLLHEWPGWQHRFETGAGDLHLLRLRPLVRRGGGGAAARRPALQTVVRSSCGGASSSRCELVEQRQRGDWRIRGLARGEQRPLLCLHGSGARGQ